MSHRYFIEPPLGEALRVTLSGAEVHHLLHVMRGKQGDEVTLFDGQGWEYIGRVARTRRSEVELELLDRRQVDRELPGQLVLAVALPKGDRQRWLVEKLTELGVTRLLPLETERAVAQPTPSALERLERAVIEASKQCGRTRLMEIAPPRTFANLLNLANESTCCWLADPAGQSLAPGERLHGLTMPSTVIAVGPEGGFTSEEVQAAVQTGWRTIGLGPRVLRVETAAIALTVLAASGMLRPEADG